ncbi:hypothetical protein TI39_contig5891g00005 [Zymoseptoria brevis]|uniref:Uncharacterized protein n=1 Tax=Zymoseptoria brevis TaxID=1047168 RepID=A0A0F4G7I2_9PEZI|nr:hypothetical protein TI39_contig5891g00005 [Zymoseptoria brevis]
MADLNESSRLGEEKLSSTTSSPCFCVECREKHASEPSGASQPGEQTSHQIQEPLTSIVSALKPAAPSTTIVSSVPTAESLREGLASLPQELCEMVYDLTFTAKTGARDITSQKLNDLKLLRVDRTSRKKYAETYYGGGSKFYFPRDYYDKRIRDLITDWLQCLSKNERALVDVVMICIETESPFYSEFFENCSADMGLTHPLRVICTHEASEKIPDVYVRGVSDHGDLEIYDSDGCRPWRSRATASPSPEDFLAVLPQELRDWVYEFTSTAATSTKQDLDSCVGIAEYIAHLKLMRISNTTRAKYAQSYFSSRTFAARHGRFWLRSICPTHREALVDVEFRGCWGDPSPSHIQKIYEMARVGREFGQSLENKVRVLSRNRRTGVWE